MLAGSISKRKTISAHPDNTFNLGISKPIAKSISNIPVR